MHLTPFSYDDYRFFFPAEHFHNRCNDRNSAIDTFFLNVQKIGDLVRSDPNFYRDEVGC